MSAGAPVQRFWTSVKRKAPSVTVYGSGSRSLRSSAYLSLRKPLPRKLRRACRRSRLVRSVVLLVILCSAASTPALCPSSTGSPFHHSSEKSSSCQSCPEAPSTGPSWNQVFVSTGGDNLCGSSGLASCLAEYLEKFSV